MSFITSYEEWLSEYRKDKYKVWIRATASNGTEYYLPEFKLWLELKKLCEEVGLGIIKVGLQYRSHSMEVDVADADGVYVIRSLLGVMGENSKQTITIGRLYGDIVKKTMYITPELIEEMKTEDHIDECFKEAVIFNVAKAGTI